MRAYILATGDELVRGRTLDRNSSEIARALTAEGVSIAGFLVVPDEPEALESAVREAGAHADLVFLTGGLGPTEDDCTRGVAARVAGVALVRLPEVEAALRERFTRRGVSMPASNLLQADIPETAELVPNRFGTAVGFRLTLPGGAHFFALPGPPHEMRGVLSEEVLPRVRALLSAQGPVGRVVRTRTIDTFGLSESDLGERIADLMRRDAHPRVGTSAEMGTIRVVVHAEGEAGVVDALLASHVQEISARLGDAVFGVDGSEIEIAVVAALRAAGATLATAESCTGGGIGHALTSVPGVSAVYAGGVVTYSDASKSELLGVPPEVIERVGAVSSEVAAAMATGVRARLGTDVGVAVTGIAGPDGGTPEKQVGLVFLAVDVRGDVKVVRRVFPGDRAFVRTLTVKAALDLVRRSLVT